MCRTSCTCVPSRSNDRCKSVAPRTTKTRTDAGSVSMSSAGPRARAAACRYRLPPAPALDARCARRSPKPPSHQKGYRFGHFGERYRALQWCTVLRSSAAHLENRRHQLSVPSGIARCSLNSRSVNALRCQHANIRRVCRARTEVVNPSLPMNSYLEPC